MGKGLYRFTVPCFIRKDTIQLRNYIQYIGYGEYVQGDGFLAVNQPDTTVGYKGAEQLVGTDCGTNEELFLILATMSNRVGGIHPYIRPNGEIYIGLQEHGSCKCTIEDVVRYYTEKYIKH